MSKPVVAIVGRPNVGKSTLFNRITGRRKAIVQDRPGVTRDRHYGQAEWGGRRFLLVDTGGFDPKDRDGVMAAVRAQCLAAVEEADVILFLMDGKQGLNPDDADIADLLRRSSKPVLYAVNKLDSDRLEPLMHEFYALGVETLFAISAAHGREVAELLDAAVALLPEATKEDADAIQTADGTEDGAEEAIDSSEVRLALVGRPNAGKSSLMNLLTGKERSVVHHAAGTTRDPVDVSFEAQGRRFLLVDTAGIRRKARIHEALEHVAVMQAIRSLERAQVALLTCDCEVGIADQEARLASMTEQSGRGLVVVLNKWDLVKTEERRKKIEDELSTRLRFVSHSPVVRTSALTGRGVQRILKEALTVHAECTKRITTSTLNRWLEEMVARRPPPAFHGKELRFYFTTQPQINPPTFVFSVSHPDGVPEAYRRFLSNRLRESFGFQGTALKLVFRRHRKKR